MKRVVSLNTDLTHAIEKLDIHDHICLIYETRQEQFATAIPFIRMGLERNEKCMYIADDNTFSSVKNAMHTEGIAVDSLIRKGALIIAQKKDAYLKESEFDPRWMIEFLKTSTKNAIKKGYKALRIAGEMTWCLGSNTPNEKIIEYESLLNNFFSKNKVLALCQYNGKQFSAKTIKDIIYSHPIIAHGGMISKNYYYIPPEELKDKSDEAKVRSLLKNIMFTQKREEADQTIQENLLYQNQLVKTITDNATLGLFLLNENHQCTYMNPPAEKMIGFTLKEVQDTSLHELVHGKNPDGSKYHEKDCPIYQSLISGKKKHGEETFIHKNGSFFPVTYTVTPIKKNKQIRGTVVEIRDMSAQRGAEEVLRMRVRQQKVVTSLGLEALAGKEPSLLMKVAAKRMAEVLNVEFTKILELLPNNTEMLLKAGHGWNKNIVINKFKESAGTNSPAGFTIMARKPIIVKDLNTETRFNSPPLLKKHGVVSGMSVVIYTQSKPYGAISVHTKNYRLFTPDDINFLQAVANVIGMAIDRKRLEKQKDEFIGIASHELKTPVTSIKGFTQVLERRFHKEGHKNAVSLLQKMDAQLNKLTSLISDLLDVTKIETGKMEFHENEFDFNNLVTEIVEAMQRTTERHTIINNLNGTRTVFGDQDRIGQVITNFLSNAIKYSPYTDRIIVKTKSQNGSIIMSVKDFGVGISKENQKHVFERFFREGGAKEDTFPGMGLGLYISSEIIKRHGGRIWVESQKGKGSIFSFELPIMKGVSHQQKNTIVEEEIKHE